MLWVMLMLNTHSRATSGRNGGRYLGFGTACWGGFLPSNRGGATGLFKRGAATALFRGPAAEEGGSSLGHEAAEARREVCEPRRQASWGNKI